MMVDTQWQNQESISEKAKFILKTGFLSDCKFIVGKSQTKKEFQVHKLILSMSSPVFEKMFQNKFTEAENDINVVDIEPDAFEAMLNFIYTDDIKFQSFDHACELYYVANKYMIPNQLKYCTSYISEEVNVTNACRAYEFAELFTLHQIIEKCKKIIQNQTSAVVSHPSFSEIQLSTLKMILEENFLSIRELDLFKAVESWADDEFKRRDICGSEHLEKREEIYKELVPNLCFLSMNSKEFAEGPALSASLSKDQAFAILMNLSSSKCSYPFPEGFSKMKRNEVIHFSNPEILLRWPVNEGKFYSLPSNCSIVEFSCNKDISIIGVRVMCQTDSGSLFVIDDLQIFFEGKQNSKLLPECRQYISFCSLTTKEAEISIYFDSPFKVHSNRWYSLGIKTNYPEAFRIGKIRAKELMYKSIRLTFHNIECNKVFLDGIMFNC